MSESEGIPLLFSNNNEESKEAYRVLEEAGIPFEHPYSAEHGPLLVVGRTYHIGITGIKKFVKSGVAKEIKEKYKK